MKVLLVHPGLSTFVQRDLEDLKSCAEVASWEWPGPRRPWRLATLARAIRRADVVLCWFAGLHAAIAVRLARVLGRPTAVIIGGYEVAGIEEIGYGAYLHPVERWASRTCLRRADLILPVSKGLLEEAQARVRELAPARVLHTGFRPAREPGNQQAQARQGVLTVAIAPDLRRLRLKGLDLLISVARLCPNMPFTVVGVTDEAHAWLEERAPQNLEILPIMSFSEVASRMDRASIYLLPSMREGLPTVLGEAMAHGCVPVSADIPGARDLMGDLGYLVDRDPRAFAHAIRRAAEAPPDIGDAVRDRIGNHFTPEVRRDVLCQELERLASRRA